MAACEVGKLQEEQHQQQQLDQEEKDAGDEAEGEEWLHVEEAPSLSLEECANEEAEVKCIVGLLDGEAQGGQLEQAEAVAIEGVEVEFSGVRSRGRQKGATTWTA
jgi:hypothetical protein